MAVSDYSLPVLTKRYQEIVNDMRVELSLTKDDEGKELATARLEFFSATLNYLQELERTKPAIKKSKNT